MRRSISWPPASTSTKVGDRVVVPFTIACGHCYFCKEQLWSLCDNSNPNAWMLEKLAGFSGSGLFGYSHMYGGYAGGQAEYVRVPFADVGPIKVPDALSDEQVLFLSDILPTGWMAAENCNIQPGDTVAVWGCGPVGQFAIKSAFLLGAERVIAYITHPVLSGKAVERVENSALDQLVVTDTIPLGEAARKCKRIRVLSVAELLAETMRRIRDEESVSSLYVD